ncbi:hypothetical protein F5Y01DRAFT_314331 [Xylaria sp. FL0043]|nr:hypothetical protein F5Y01DRAFT_314331 [Xylaria sp. FL0043]
MYATRALRMVPTKRMMRVPKEDQQAHTVSQRLRKLRQIPAELIPLGSSAPGRLRRLSRQEPLETNRSNKIGAVVIFAVFAAGYSSARKFWVDKNLRLARQNRKDEPVEHH